MNPNNLIDAQNQQAQSNIDAATQDIQPVGQQMSYPIDYVTQSLITQIVKDYVSKQSFGGVNGCQIFTTSGTFTVPSGFTKFWVRAVGGGQGGGFASAGGAVGNPGKAGDYVESVVVPSTSTVTVTIGALGAGASSLGDGANGGDTSFGSLLVAKGGNSSTTSVGTFILSGAFPPLTPDFNFAQGSLTNRAFISRSGWGSPFGHGGLAALAAAGASTGGTAATGYGSGGAGAATGNGAAGTANGGDGAGGLVIVIW